MNECVAPESNNIVAGTELIRSIPIAMPEPSAVASTLIWLTLAILNLKGKWPQLFPIIDFDV
jgi:hypothetical protein